MVNKLQHYLHSTCTSTIDSVFDYGKGKIFSLIKNHFCYELQYESRITDKKFERTLELLKRLDHKKFIKASIYDRQRLKMRSEIWYTISLPKLDSYIIVSTGAGNNEGISSNIKIYVLGKGAVRTARMFENTVAKKRGQQNNLEKATIVAYEMTLGSRGIRWQSNQVYVKCMENIFTIEKDSILSYLEKWTAASNLFKNLEISYKTGVLLYGPPGTGKTSMAKSLAAYLDCDLYVVNMSLFNTESIQAVKSLDNDLKIVLLEDIDYIFGKRQNDRTPEEKANGNELLQLLDGVTPVSNTIFIATTNDYESLDDAIVRDGRFDLKIYMDNLTESDAKTMCSALYLKEADTAEVLQGESFPINPAYLQNKIVQHIFKHLDSFEEVTSVADVQHSKKETDSWQ